LRGGRHDRAPRKAGMRTAAHESAHRRVARRRSSPRRSPRRAQIQQRQAAVECTQSTRAGVQYAQRRGATAGGRKAYWALTTGFGGSSGAGAGRGAAAVRVQPRNPIRLHRFAQKATKRHTHRGPPLLSAHNECPRTPLPPPHQTHESVAVLFGHFILAVAQF
jgi:hypothetical protein